MDHEYKPPPPETSEVSEPAVACYAGTRPAEPWAAPVPDELDGDGFDWDSLDGPEELKVHSFEEFKRKLDESLASLLAGRVTPHEEAEREFWQWVETEGYKNA
jgi:hypothetical protein